MKRSPLKRRTPLRRRTRLRRSSRTGAAISAAYRPRARAFVRAHPRCEVNEFLSGSVAPRFLVDIRDRVFAGRCKRRSTQVHHVRGRGRKLTLDERHWLAVCAPHHRWITDNGREAERLGYVERPWRVEKTETAEGPQKPYFRLDARSSPRENSLTMAKKSGGGIKKKVGGVASKPSVRKPKRPAKMMKGVGPGGF